MIPVKHRDKPLGPGLGVALLAAVTIGSIYWTAEFVGEQEYYFSGLVGGMDQAIEEAYGQGTVEEQFSQKRK
jgi:hypothetical protein